MTVIKHGNLRGEKYAGIDGDVWGCVWYPIDDDNDDEEEGMCFDFDFTDVDDLIQLLEEMKKTKVEVWEEVEDF